MHLLAVAPYVFSALGEDDVPAAAAREPIATGTAAEAVVSCTSEEPVVPALAEDAVGASASADGVCLARPDEGVGVRGADDLPCNGGGRQHARAHESEGDRQVPNPSPPLVHPDPAHDRPEASTSVG